VGITGVSMAGIGGKSKAAKTASRPSSTSTDQAKEANENTSEETSPEDRRRKTAPSSGAGRDTATKLAGPGFTHAAGPGSTPAAVPGSTPAAVPGSTPAAVPGFTQGVMEQQPTAMDTQTVQESGSEPLAGSDRLPKLYAYASCVGTDIINLVRTHEIDFAKELDETIGPVNSY